MRRVTRVLTHSEEYPLAQASRLASRFRLAHPVEVHDFPEKGNINQHTFVVVAGVSAPREYLLQRINERVFTRPRSVMRAMIASIDAQQASMAAGRLSPGDEWEAITLVDTHDGVPLAVPVGTQVLRWALTHWPVKRFTMLSGIAMLGKRLETTPPCPVLKSTLHSKLCSRF